jgi:anti-sigma-K factor RskA
MIPVKHIDPDDIALYAMQLLPPDEAEEMSLHLQHSAEARRVLAEVYSDLSLFAHSAEMQSPPPLARQRLMKHVAREKKVLPPDPLANFQTGAYAPRPNVSLFEEQVARRSAASRALPWVGWALAAGIGAFSATLYLQNDRLKDSVALSQAQLKQTRSSAEQASMVLDTLKDPAALRVVLSTTDKLPPPAGRVTYVQDKGALLLTASNLDKLQPYKVYELWLIPQDGRDPIPAGTFRPDDRGFATVVLPELPKGIAPKAFGVTIEDGDGSPVPTSAVILKGVVS